MTVTEIKDISAKKALVITDDEYAFPLSLSDIKKYSLTKDGEISGDTLDEIKEKHLYPVALNRSLYLIRSKEYTKHEIEQKLRKSFYPDDIISSVTTELEKNNFINDKRYAENYISCHCAMKSAQAVTSALIMKGIKKEIIEDTMDSYLEENPEQEMSLCIQMLERRYDSVREQKDPGTLNKAKMFLARKGFSYSVADSAVKEFFDI